jgi:lipopolysaccharide transport system permease protein
MKIKKYSSHHRFTFHSLFKEVLLGFIEGRELGFRLFIRDLKASYKKSYLGILWLFFPAITNGLIWTFLHSQKIIKINDAPMSYGAFALTGTVLWSLFSEAVALPIQRYQKAMPLMSKLYFPHEAIILASIYDIIFSLSLKLLILIPALSFIGYLPTFNFIPAILIMLLLALTGLSIGLLLTPLGLLYSDIGKSISMILPFLMYLTPVIYPIQTSGTLLFFQKFNPVTPFLEYARSLIGQYPFILYTELFIWSTLMILIVAFSLVLLKISLPIIVERSGS